MNSWESKCSTKTLIKEYLKFGGGNHKSNDNYINEFYGNGNTINFYFHRIENELRNRLSEDEFDKLYYKARGL